jgi:hypothetical protein
MVAPASNSTHRFEYGIHTDQHIANSVDPFTLRMAAESGNPVAQVILGFKYEHGMGVEIDYQEAARLYTLAAKPRTC